MFHSKHVGIIIDVKQTSYCTFCTSFRKSPEKKSNCYYQDFLKLSTNPEYKYKQKKLTELRDNSDTRRFADRYLKENKIEKPYQFNDENCRKIELKKSKTFFENQFSPLKKEETKEVQGENKDSRLLCKLVSFFSQIVVAIFCLLCKNI